MQMKTILKLLGGYSSQKYLLIVLKCHLRCCTSRGANVCWAIGGTICNFTPILPYFLHSLFSTFSTDEPRPRFFSVEQIKWRPKERSLPKLEDFFPRIQMKTKKKKVFTKNWTLFSPNSSGDLRLDANYWRGCRWRPYSNYCGDTVKL